jgi:hypothetical protein
LGDRRGAYRVLVGIPDDESWLERPMFRWEDNIKVDVQEVRWEAWTGLICLRTGACGGLL